MSEVGYMAHQQKMLHTPALDSQSSWAKQSIIILCFYSIGDDLYSSAS